MCLGIQDAFRPERVDKVKQKMCLDLNTSIHI
jgi:hypothetical protein